MKGKMILVVEDEPIVGLSLKHYLQDKGFEVAVVVSGAEALAEVQRRVPGLVLMDVKIKGPIDGVETARRILAQHAVRIVFVTAYKDAALSEAIHSLGVEAILEKPYTNEQLDQFIAGP